MATKLYKEEGAREPFRPRFNLDAVARIKRDDVNFNYKLVIYNYKHRPDAVAEHEAMGYEVVYSTDHIEDDRKFASGTTAEGESLRPRAVLKTTKDGYEQVLMRISKERQKENQAKADERRTERYKRSVKGIKTADGHVRVNDGEINLNQLNNGDTNE